MTSPQNEIGEANRITADTDRMIIQDGLMPPGKNIRILLEDGCPPIHNFTGDAMAVYRLTALVCSPTVKRGSDKLNTPFFPRYFYAQMVEMTNERTGEIVNNPRVVIVDRDGDCWGFTSYGILDSLDHIISAFGMRTWPAELKVQVIQSKTRKGMNILSLVPVE